MNFFDKMYYLFYCCQTGGRGTPVTKEIDAKRYEQGHSNTRALFFITMAIYIGDILKYTGLFFLIKSKNERIFIFIGIALVVMLLINLNFTKRGETIVSIYEEKRSASKKADFWRGFIFGVSSFVLLGLYDWIKDAGAPLPNSIYSEIAVLLIVLKYTK